MVTRMTEPSPTPELLFEVRHKIGLVTFNRPAARNALTFAMYDRLAEICTSVNVGALAQAPTRVDPAVELRCLIITGAGGRAFAAGTDIAQFRDFTTPAQAIAYERHMDEVLTTIERCPVPVIAAMSGATTGGGAAIALACDLRLASADLQFGVPIARTLGNCLSVASLSRLTQLIGAGRTAELMMTARLLEASQALSLGLVTEVTADHASVLARAFDLARTLAGHAPLTLRATKEALRRLRIEGAGADDTDLITMTYMSDDFREGLEAFLAKRPPQWKGR